MATSNNPFLKGFRGHIEKTVVVKQYPGDRTIITAYPDMSRVKPSKDQKVQRSLFKEAVAYAKGILADSIENQKAQSRLYQRTGSLYHALLKEYMQQHSKKV
ncbi:MAG: hypothetical protein IE931_13535 [Sphingobacteriales bacterium]|nr:hypothetical protein [Sphingobacteriales bacterium]